MFSIIDLFSLFIILIISHPWKFGFRWIIYHHISQRYDIDRRFTQIFFECKNYPTLVRETKPISSIECQQTSWTCSVPMAHFSFYFIFISFWCSWSYFHRDSRHSKTQKSMRIKFDTILNLIKTKMHMLGMFYSLKILYTIVFDTFFICDVI